MSTSSSDRALSALVVLRPAPGRALGDSGPVTAATVEASLPPPAAVERAREAFRSRGFEVAEAVGPSFSITAARARFEEVFAPLAVEPAGTGVAARTEAGSLELPLDGLPADVRDTVQAVTFTPPPDFGPTEFR